MHLCEIYIYILLKYIYILIIINYTYNRIKNKIELIVELIKYYNK